MIHTQLSLPKNTFPKFIKLHGAQFHKYQLSNFEVFFIEKLPTKSTIEKQRTDKKKKKKTSCTAKTTEKKYFTSNTKNQLHYTHI
jgi:hypothetical protein